MIGHSQTSRSVDPARLEELGKTAAQLSMSSGLGLTEAVVRTIGNVKLGAEQIRRVVEAANHDAFNHKYAQTSGTVRAVHFDDGPADPVTVIQALKVAAAPVVVEERSSDYDLPPAFMKASETEFDLEPVYRTASGVQQEILGLHHKLASAHEETIAGIEVAREQMTAALGELAQATKMATHYSGTTADDLVGAWSSIDPDLALVAAERLGLALTGIKTAGVTVNPQHGVVLAFEKFAAATDSYIVYDRARASLEVEMAKVGHWLGRKAAA